MLLKLLGFYALLVKTPICARKEVPVELQGNEPNWGTGLYC